MVQLKGIPTILSPELLNALARMGHGDEIVFGDSNFPAETCAKHILIRADGHNIPALLEAVLKLFPLDQYVEKPVATMQLVPSDAAKGLKVPVWDVYKRLVRESEGKEVPFEEVERFAFYERAKKAFAVVATSETVHYGNIILKKGVI
eukprot:Opistho-1_new@28716